MTENQLKFFSKSHDSHIKLLGLAIGNKDEHSLDGSSLTNGDVDHNSVDKSSSDDLDSSCSIDLSEWTRKLNTIVTDEESQFRALQRQVGELAPAIGQLYKRIVTEKQLGREWSEVTREIVNISSSGIKARTHVGKLKDSWQHLLRDRASRTLTYNDEQFHILEKIKMQETIRVLQDLLQKECTPSINQMTDALADWYKMAQTTFLQAEILSKDICAYEDEIDTFTVALKSSQERYEALLSEVL